MLNDGGTLSASSNTVSVANADSVTILIAAATSYKSYNDVTGDPEAVVKKQIAAAAKAKFDRLLAAHTKEHQRLFRRVGIDLGRSDAMQLPTDDRVKTLAAATTRNSPRSISSSGVTC